MKPVGEPDAGNPHVRFDERGRETEPRRRLRHWRKAKAASNSYSLRLKPPRPSSTPPIAPAAVFIWAASPAAAEKVDFFQRMSAQIRNMATGVVHARAQHPNKTILLARIPSEVFYASVYHDLFPLVGVYDVYLAPDLVELEELPGYETADEHFLSPQQTLLGIRRDSLVVYDASQGRLREITSRYRAFAPVRLMFEAAEEPDK